MVTASRAHATARSTPPRERPRPLPTTPANAMAEDAEGLRRAALAEYARTVGLAESDTFQDFIARQSALFVEQRELSDALEQQRATLPTAVVAALNDTERLWRDIDEEFDLLTSLEAAVAAGARSNRSWASDQRRAGRLLGLPRLNKFVYPGFQFGADGLRPVIADLRQLATEHDLTERDVIVWLCRPTTYFPEPEQRPVDHLDEPDWVLDVARSAWDVTW